jgi:hypothetical protein
MLVSVELGAEFSRGCAGRRMGNSRASGRGNTLSSTLQKIPDIPEKLT